jgi:hypothetical protein
MAATAACLECFGEAPCPGVPAVLYQVNDLGELPETLCSEQFEHETQIIAQGVNNRGDVVGRVLCVENTLVISSRGFVWLGDRRFGLPGHQIILLPLSEGSNDNSAAFDINDDGIIVGWEGTGSGSSASTSLAVYWDLAEDDFPPHTIPGPDDPRADDPYIAYGVNNRSAFQVVGVYLQGFPGNQHFDHGFVFTEGDDESLTLIPLLDDPIPWEVSHGFAINDATPALIGGLSLDCPGAPGGCVTSQAVDCDDVAGDATFWTKTSPPIAPGALRQPDFSAETELELEGEVQGVNNLGNLVGAGVECIGTDLSDRLRRALIWTSISDGNPDNLGQLVIDLENDDDKESIANGVSETTPLVVAGWNSTDRYAVIWKDINGWCIIRLIEAIDPSVDPDRVWDSLIEATDINEDGWIVGYGIIDQGPSTPLMVRSFLLIPLAEPESCLADIDDDGDVDVNDLVELILAWGQSGGDADVDGSGLVDVGDLIAVIIAWGPCPGESGSVLSLADELEGAALEWPEDWDAFMQNIDDQNYRCWMYHYLTSPCGVLCPEPPDCPGSDPYH